jgi:acetyltransferase-like isoleucine patch superfamily enzyme
VRDGRLSTLGLGAREAFAAPWRLFVRQLPGPLGARLRSRHWSRRLGALGEGARIDEGVQIVNPGSVFIGARCWIASNAVIGAGPPSTAGRDVIRRRNGGFAGSEGEVRLGDDVEIAVGALISGHGGVEIGDNVSLGPGAKLFSASNHYRGPDGEPGLRSAGAGMRREPSADGQMGRQSLVVGPVVIAGEAFVGSGAIVLPGVTVGRGAWLGAGVVARRSIEPGQIVRSPDPIAVESAEDRVE